MQRQASCSMFWLIRGILVIFAVAISAGKSRADTVNIGDHLYISVIHDFAPNPVVVGQETECVLAIRSDNPDVQVEMEDWIGEGEGVPASWTALFYVASDAARSDWHNSSATYRQEPGPDDDAFATTFIVKFDVGYWDAYVTGTVSFGNDHSPDWYVGSATTDVPPSEALSQVQVEAYGPSAILLDHIIVDAPLMGPSYFGAYSRMQLKIWNNQTPPDLYEDGSAQEEFGPLSCTIPGYVLQYPSTWPAGSTIVDTIRIRTADAVLASGWTSYDDLSLHIHTSLMSFKQR